MTYQTWDKLSISELRNLEVQQITLHLEPKNVFFSNWNERFVPFSRTNNFNFFPGNQTTSLDQPSPCFLQVFVTDFLFQKSRLRCESSLTTGLALINQLQTRMWDCFFCMISKDVQQCSFLGSINPVLNAQIFFSIILIPWKNCRQKVWFRCP